MPAPGIYVTARVSDGARRRHELTEAGTVRADGADEPIWRLTERTS